MAVDYTNTFESGGLGTWTTVSAAPPTVVSSPTLVGGFAMRSDISSASQYVIRNYAVEPGVPAIRFYLYIDSVGSSSFDSILAQSYNSAQTDDISIVLSVNGSGNPSLYARLYDGGSTFNSASTPTLSLDTLYRVECKVDMSVAAWKVTWGYAVGHGALTTINTDFTGGTEGATTADAWFIGQATVDAGRILLYDDIVIAEGTDYPIGPSVHQPPVAWLVA